MIISLVIAVKLKKSFAIFVPLEKLMRLQTDAKRVKYYIVMKRIKANNQIVNCIYCYQFSKMSEI